MTVDVTGVFPRSPTRRSRGGGSPATANDPFNPASVQLADRRWRQAYAANRTAQAGNGDLMALLLLLRTAGHRADHGEHGVPVGGSVSRSCRWSVVDSAA